MLLGERLVKVLVVVVAVMAIVTIVGVNTKTALECLGIGESRLRSAHNGRWRTFLVESFC